MLGDPESYAVTSSRWDASTPAYRLPHTAMGCEFQITVLDRPADLSLEAAREAFEELDRIEAELSRFHPGSDVWLINHLTPGHPLTVSPCTIECLQLAAAVHAETHGCFDVTIGALRRCWRDDEGELLSPESDELAAARGCTGTELIEICAEDHTVTVRAEGVQVDLGGIGKGYAVDEMAKVLAEWDIEIAQINAGNSTYVALGRPPGRDCWTLDITEVETLQPPPFRLHNRAASASGVNTGHEHILDPHTRCPLLGHHVAWSTAPSAALADALSTAFVLMTVEQVRDYCRRHPDAGAMLALLHDQPPRIERFGHWD